MIAAALAPLASPEFEKLTSPTWNTNTSVADIAPAVFGGTLTKVRLSPILAKAAVERSDLTQALTFYQHAGDLSADPQCGRHWPSNTRSIS